eukprot:jgi/Botrbrau1/15694/Bobra.4_1s0070.4
MFTRQCLHTSRNFRAATRGLVRAVAETEKQAEPEVRNVDNEPRTLSFGNNSRSGVGYTAEDSAGQSNIFAVEVSHESVWSLSRCTVQVLQCSVLFLFE